MIKEVEYFVEYIHLGQSYYKNKTHPRERMGKNCYEKEK